MREFTIPRALILLLLFIFTSSLSALELKIHEDTTAFQMLKYSQIYVDRTQTKNITNILKDSKNIFQKNDKSSLAFGYSPKFNVWIKVTLHNISSKKLKKIIEYDNPLTTDIEFYDPDIGYKIQKGGLLHKQLGSSTLNPIFHITLKPKETKTYYIKTSSKITTLIIRLKLWNVENFYNKEIIHQIFLALFFGAMVILAIYNLFIYFFTRDISYLFYVAYIVGLILHQLVYVGFASTHILNTQQIKIVIDFASLLVAFPIFSLGLFTKSFLHTKQYKRHNFMLVILLILIPVVVLFFIFNQNYIQYRNFFPISVLIYLLYLTIYAALKKNQQAYFILFGWFVFALSATLMHLSSAGIFSVENYFPYLIEVSFLLEAVIFSIALANRINNLQEEKNEANEKLFYQKKQENIRLEKTVKEKTQSLTNALDEKNVLLKELNHRVKNNLQTIISLIRLQSYELEDISLQESLKTIQNRVAAMSHLHELLYKQENLKQVQTNSYFQAIINELQESYFEDLTIKFDITVDLETEEAIYCGLILNELVTNSIKHAFKTYKEKEKIIYVHLSCQNKNVTLEVQDNGIGFDRTTTTNSLGLILVETLAIQQLNGKCLIEFKEGTRTVISWER